MTDPKMPAEIVEELLRQYSEQRTSLLQMILDLEKLKEKIETLIPNSLDTRYVRLFEEKVKSLTSFFGTLLEIRKEILKSIKDEIEIRRKIERDEESDEDFAKIFDIRSLAKKVEAFQNSTELITGRLEQKTKLLNSEERSE